MVDIPINDSGRRNQYVATGGETEFDYGFAIFDAGHISVQMSDPADLDNPVTLDRGTHYNVTGVGSETGGTIELLAGEFPDGAEAGFVFTLLSAMPYERMNDYQFSGDFESSDVNIDFDSLVIMCQQLRRGLMATARLQDTDPLTTLSIRVEPVAQRANRALLFSADGTQLIAGPTIQELGTVSENIAAIVNVSDNIASVVNVSDNMSFVVSAYDNRAAISSVANIAQQIVNVSQNIPDIQTVAGMDENIEEVISNASSINTVASNIADITAIAGNIDEVYRVGQDIEDVKICAANMTDIIQASDNADAAQIYASNAENSSIRAGQWASYPEDETIPGTGGGYSAYHWAMKAQEFAGGVASSITVDNSTWNVLKGANAQEAFNSVDELFEVRTREEEQIFDDLSDFDTNPDWIASGDLVAEQSSLHVAGGDSSIEIVTDAGGDTGLVTRESVPVGSYRASVYFETAGQLSINGVNSGAIAAGNSAEIEFDVLATGLYANEIVISPNGASGGLTYYVSNIRVDAQIEEVAAKGSVQSQDVQRIIKLTQAEYDALDVKDPAVLYIVVDA